MATTGRTEKLTPAQLAWTRFVDKVERGEQVDPTGQYVSKGTNAAPDASGQRISRPKFDAATTAHSTRYVLNSKGEIGGKAAKNIETDYAPPICEECGGGGGGPIITSTFVSSEGVAPYSGTDNPKGYIHDLKISFDRADGASKCCYHVVRNAYTGERDGYTRLQADLNKGVGGPYIYLSFTRNPSKVFIGGMGLPAGSTTPVTEIKVSSLCCFDSDIVIPDAFGYITGANDDFIEQIDLNADAGGRYVYSFQSKDSAKGTPIESRCTKWE